MIKGSASLRFGGDDIVHPFRKLWDKCNQLVVGSSPTRGANKNILAGVFLFPKYVIK